MTTKRLMICRGTGYAAGGRAGGAHWMQYHHCPICGKKIGLTKTGRLRKHGTFRKIDEPR